MNEDIEKLLREEINTEIRELEKIELGGDVYKISVNGITQLCDRLIEFKKLEMEKGQRDAQRSMDANLKLTEIESEDKDRKIKNRITFASIVIPLVVGSFWSYKSLKFEENDTITSTVGRNMMNSLTKLNFWK